MTNCWLGFATFRFALFIAVMFAVRAPEAAGDPIELKQHTAPVHTIQWSADGKRLASACEDGVYVSGMQLGNWFPRYESKRLRSAVPAFAARA